MWNYTHIIHMWTFFPCKIPNNVQINSMTSRKQTVNFKIQKPQNPQLWMEGILCIICISYPYFFSFSFE